MTTASRIKLKQLELFAKIAESGQLQLAAQSVAISQPAASRSLHELESQTGCKLFLRTPTGMELTLEGKAFLRRTQVILSEIDGMGSELKSLRAGRLGQVRVGAVNGPAVGHLMPAVHSLLEDSPDLQISVDVAPSTVLFRGLEEARYDFILGRVDPSQNRADYLFLPGRTEVVSLMVHTSHPLAGQKQVDLADLDDYPWVIQQEGSPIRVAVEEAFFLQGLPVPSRVLNSSSLLVALAQIENGRTISPQAEEVVRLLASERMGANVTVLDTNAPMIVAPYFVIRDARRNLPQAASKLMEEVVSRF